MMMILENRILTRATKTDVMKEMPKILQQKVAICSDITILEEIKGELDFSDSKIYSSFFRERSSKTQKSCLKKS